QSMAADYFLSYLDGRKGWLEAVCLTGGEPLLHEDLEDVIRIVRERGLLVKLDTNGSFPDRLEALLGLGLLDRVALDVKAPSSATARSPGRRSTSRRSSGASISSATRASPTCSGPPSSPASWARTMSSGSASGSKGPRATSSSRSYPKRRSTPPSWPSSRSAGPSSRTSRPRPGLFRRGPR
ncbi:MAG: radical SAM protein, partial [Ignavibacteriales bacterium]|nr:radical SAM protein [Ignavibacteriales bacterium]